MGKEAKIPLVTRSSDSGRWERVRILNFWMSNISTTHNHIPKYFWSLTFKKGLLLNDIKQIINPFSVWDKRSGAISSEDYYWWNLYFFSQINSSCATFLLKILNKIFSFFYFIDLKAHLKTRKRFWRSVWTIWWTILDIWINRRMTIKKIRWLIYIANRWIANKVIDSNIKELCLRDGAQEQIVPEIYTRMFEVLMRYRYQNRVSNWSPWCQKRRG